MDIMLKDKNGVVLKTEKKYCKEDITVRVDTEELNVTPGPEEQIQEGLFNKVTVPGDANLIPENIKEGTNIFGVEGSAELRGEENAIVDGDAAASKHTSVEYIVNRLIKDMKISSIDIGDKVTTASMFRECRSLKNIPYIDTSNVKAMHYMFYHCATITTIPLLNTDKVTNMSYMFAYCESLTDVPELNTANVTDMNHMFSSCKKIKTIPLLNTSKVTDMNNIFYGCTELTEIPLLNTSNVTNMNHMFSYCDSLETIPQLDTSNVTNMSYFSYNNGLVTLPQLNTSKVTNMGFMFVSSKKITNVAELDAQNVNNINKAFDYVSTLVNMGGFKDLGKAYAQKSNNYTSYALAVKYSVNLTHESLMNIINNLYDLNLSYNVANGGTLYTQQLQIGAENIAKLTAEEIAIATNKGWNVS